MHQCTLASCRCSAWQRPAQASAALGFKSRAQIRFIVRAFGYCMDQQGPLPAGEGSKPFINCIWPATSASFTKHACQRILSSIASGQSCCCQPIGMHVASTSLRFGEAAVQCLYLIQTLLNQHESCILEAPLQSAAGAILLCRELYCPV
jgi:hypothetical protein